MCKYPHFSQNRREVGHPSGNIQDFNYGYNLGTADNGNIASMVGVGTQSFNRTYSYDALNRLSTMADSASNQGCKGLRWTYDAWGNRTNQAVTSGSCFTFSAAATTQNRLVGFQYDAAGNLINDGSHTYTYDAENRIIKVDGGSTATYAYDADGLRVTKTTGGSWTDYLYDLSSRQITEIIPNSWRTGYVYFGGGLLAQYQNSTTSFVYSDHLGSTRIVGNLNGTVHDSMDYLPFGEQMFGNSSTTHKFTGKERDSESGLDMFGARYYASSMGRFMTPDFGGPMPTPDPVPWADLEDPQTLNLYAYARNNPVSLADEDGHTYHICDEHGQNCSDVSDEQFAQIQKNAQQSGETWKNGNIYLTDANGNLQLKGTYNQTDVDLNPNAQAVFSSPVLQTTAATMSDPRTYALWFGASATLGYGLYAAGAFEGGLTTLEIGAEASEATPSAGQVAQAERVLQQNGRKSVEKAIRTLEKRLAQHVEKIKNATGHTSSMEREVENFKQLIQAYKDVLK